MERLTPSYGRDAARPGVYASAYAHAHGRPDRIALVHMRSLQTLDGLAAGATQRAEIAQAMFGTAVVATSAGTTWVNCAHRCAGLRAAARRWWTVATGAYFRSKRAGTDV
ncbi:MAG: hypothetical protein R3E92_00345 [Burkholderiaceae bacterium]